MLIDNPRAYHFMMQDDLYLLDEDKGVKTVESTVLATPVTAAAIEEAEPELPSATIAEVVISIPRDVATPIAQPILQTQQPEFKYLGRNNKRFLILTNYANEAFMAAAHLTALENILKRKGFAIDDVVILNMYTYPHAAIKELHNHFKPEKILILGAGAIPAGLKIPQLNQPIRTSSIAILYSFSFDEMMESNDNKKAFWEQMKNL